MNPNKANLGLGGIVRLCVLMLALSLATMCLSFGTVAKYATSDSAQDSARVAKFGVQIEATDESTFQTEYSSADNTITVKSSNGDKLVAPGTSDENGLCFTITGNPEVATQVDIDLSFDKDVFLKMQKDGAPYYYYPVKFTLTKNDTVLAEGNLEAIEQAFDSYSASARYEAFTAIGSNFSLSWEWDYTAADAVTDTWDTLLGDIAAGIVPTGYVDGEDYCLDISYSVTISVYQVD